MRRKVGGGWAKSTSWVQGRLIPDHAVAVSARTRRFAGSALQLAMTRRKRVAITMFPALVVAAAACVCCFCGDADELAGSLRWPSRVVRLHAVSTSTTLRSGKSWRL